MNNSESKLKNLSVGTFTDVKQIEASSFDIISDHYKPTEKFSRKEIELKYLREKAEFGMLATRYEVCGEMFVAHRCLDCGKVCYTHTGSCNLRICSSCCKKQYWRIKKRILRPIEAFGYVRGQKYRNIMTREITLTWKEPLTETNYQNIIIDRRKEVNKLLNHYRRKGILLGSLIVFETKRSSKDLTRIHIHAHILAITKYISQRELSQRWEKISGNNVVWIQLRNPESSIGYLLKHIYKPPEILPSDVVLFLKTFLNRRRVTSNGILYKMKILTCDKAITFNLICCYCGSDSLEILGITSIWKLARKLEPWCADG
jgi:hypothetical protein